MATIQDVINEWRQDFADDAALADFPFPEYPLNALNGPWPMFIAYAGIVAWRPGTNDMGDGTGVPVPAMAGAHTINLNAVWTYKDAPRDVKRVMALEQTIPHCLMAGFVRDQWGGTVTALGDQWSFEQGASGGSTGQAIRGTFGPIDWLSQPDRQFVGFMFEIDISVEEEITV
jgi:hypothetical protein